MRSGYNVDSALELLRERMGTMVLEWSITLQQKFQTAFIKVNRVALTYFTTMSHPWLVSVVR
jgi:hypothetical protein